jgi:4,5-DOPA dioxygenase extradiol
MKQPQTIHDFGGFPEELFAVQYPAKGDPVLASEIVSNIKSTTVELDQKWGLDHGTWSVVKHLYPLADVPVLQMSIDYTKPPEWHYNLARELAFLRKKGVLIIGSGNMVHNLGKLNWKNDSTFDWAAEAHDILKQKIENRDHKSLINYKELGTSVQLAIPTNEHYLPLIYAVALQHQNENIQYFNDTLDMGSIAMTSLLIL